MVWAAPTSGIQYTMLELLRTNKCKKQSKINVTIVGIDLAKSVFHLHGMEVGGDVVFRRKMRRSAVLDFLRDLSSCLVGLAEFGIITAVGPYRLLSRIRVVEAGDGPNLPPMARAALDSLITQLDTLTDEVRKPLA